MTGVPDDTRLDDLLAAAWPEDGAGPAPDLTGRVMAEVLREARRPRPLPFPWRRFLAQCALTTACVAIGAGIVVGRARPGLDATAWHGLTALAVILSLLVLLDLLAGRRAHSR